MGRCGKGLCGEQHDQLTSGILDAVVHPGSLVRQLGNACFPVCAHDGQCLEWLGAYTGTHRC
jgi:hypothetical protein